NECCQIGCRRDRLRPDTSCTSLRTRTLADESAEQIQRRVQWKLEICNDAARNFRSDFFDFGVQFLRHFNRIKVAVLIETMVEKCDVFQVRFEILAHECANPARRAEFSSSRQDRREPR